MTGGFSTFGDTDDTAASDVHYRGYARVRGPGWAKFPLITIGLLGVQIFWSVEMSYGMCFRLGGAFGFTVLVGYRLLTWFAFAASPYLLSLGLSKSYMALVFVAGPLSGLIVQPLIGEVLLFELAKTSE